MKMRIRTYPQSNYRAIFINGKTVRQKLDYSKDFSTPPTPELEDIALNSKCYANCSYCYTSATKNGVNFTNIVDKAKEVWGSLDIKERPFQIAIGGAGESTIHPHWIDFVKAVKELSIVPNYTTNGMHLSKEIINATIDYCGGVAVSYHPHIKNVFSESITKLEKIREEKLKLNVHVIVGDNQSFLDLQMIYETFKDRLDYFVILPYQAAGRGISIDTKETWLKTFDWIGALPLERQTQFAFGALFFDFLKENTISLNVDMYEPEIFSGYRLLDDSYKLLRKSSYDLNPKLV